MVSSTSAIVDMSVGPSASGGVNSTDSPVNSESKYRVSVSDITCGLNGGSIYSRIENRPNCWSVNLISDIKKIAPTARGSKET